MHFQVEMLPGCCTPSLENLPQRNIRRRRLGYSVRQLPSGLSAAEGTLLSRVRHLRRRLTHNISDDRRWVAAL